MAISPALARLPTRLADLAGSAAGPGDFLAESVSAIEAGTAANRLAFVIAESGTWRVVAQRGPAGPLPFDLAAEALDRESGCHSGGWRAIPLGPFSLQRARIPLPDAALLLDAPELTDQSAEFLADALSIAWQLAWQRYRSEQRLRRLDRILEIAQQWYQADDLSDLLERIAGAAADLLAADRASIFLWDKNSKTLVGRPALGIEGNELRIPDHAGVAGDVLTSGESRCVNSTHPGDDPINREVDQSTGYATETLLCVPLTSTSGERFGVFEVLNKNDGRFTPDDERGLKELAAHAAVALERTQQFESLVQRHRALVDEHAAGVQLIGECPAIDALRSTIRRVARTDLAVLLLGENGTGKEVVARQIHYLSERRNEPFIAVNCAALAETLLESELFGHERGAFTDAREMRQGKFELASGGTLFLDEIGDMSLSGQAKLLRVLEEKTIVRVGGSTPIHTEVRVLTATNQDLAKLVREGQFRQDLFFRLNVVAIELPPLRERNEDVLLLADHFLSAFCRTMGRRVPTLSAAARKKLLAHTWPGNVRELRNLMERLAYLSTEPKIDANDLVLATGTEAATPALLDSTQPLSDATQQFQIEYIRRTIDRAGGNMSAAAARLGLHRSNLYRKMRQLGLQPDEQ